MAEEFVESQKSKYPELEAKYDELGALFAKKYVITSRTIVSSVVPTFLNIVMASSLFSFAWFQHDFSLLFKGFGISYLLLSKISSRILRTTRATIFLR